MADAMWTVTTFDPDTMQYREFTTTDPFDAQNPVHRVIDALRSDWGIIDVAHPYG